MVVSSCLLGEPVRYDGAARPNHWIVHELAQWVDFIPLCPEAGAGLGIPRPPVQLIRMPSGVQALGVDDPSLDVTEPLVTWTQIHLPELSSVAACVLKARSPSCGYLSTPLFDPVGNQLDRVSGLFAAALRDRFPDLLIVDEDMLLSESDREGFLQAIVQNSLARQ